MITGFSGVVDINVLAVKIIMDLHGVEDQRSCMEKVRLIFSDWMGAMREKYDAKPED